MHHRSIKLRALALALAVGAGAAAASCGGDSKEQPQPAPDPNGMAGATSDAGTPVECGGEMCQGVKLVNPYADVEPCCAEGDVCGLDTTFLAAFGPMFSPACQAHDQPGEDGHGCPDSPALMVPNSTLTIPAQKGCCRTETKTCGYRLDYLIPPLLFNVGLGCVDSTPFLDGGTPMDCDPESP